MPAGPGDERATGGMITYDGEFIQHLFLTNGTFTPIDGAIDDAEYFAVGGGPGSSGGVSGVRYGAGSSGAQVLTGLIDIPNAPQAITIGVASNGTIGSVTPANATATTIGTLVTALPGTVAPHTQSNGANSPNGFTGGASTGGTSSGGGAGAAANGSTITGGDGVLSSLPTGSPVVYGSGGGAVSTGGSPVGNGGTGAGAGSGSAQGGHATTRGSAGGGGNSTSGGGNGLGGLAFIRYAKVYAPPTDTERRDVDIWLHDFRQQPSIQLQTVKDYWVEKFLQGSEQLFFVLPLGEPKAVFLHEDQLVLAHNMYWYIDHFEETHPGDIMVVCNARHITELTWKIRFGIFSLLAKTPAEGLADILAGTDWTVDVAPPSIQLYTMEEMDATALTLLRNWATITGYELSFDTLARTVSMVAQVGQPRGIGFRWSYSIREITREFFPPPATRLYPVGANNLVISDVNPTGLPYIEDYSFYEAQGLSTVEARALYRKDLPWVDDRYLLAVNLYDAAVARLAKLSQPRVFYKAKVLDLSRIMEADAY